MLRKTKQLIFFTLLLITPFRSCSQISFSQNHPELRWQTFETEHFKIIYHQGIEVLAIEVARVAEEVYSPITADLGVEPPRKTPIIVTDYLDYSNGLATPLGHYIIIWSPSETKYMTGRIKWLRAVVAHEFTHTVNFWAFRAFPGFWRELLALGFIPTWFLEGIAEYEAEQWCEHRDMLMRVVSYHRKLLPYKKMTGYIGTDQIGSRLVYEQGHSLIRFIVHKFGHDKIRDIIKKYRALPISFNLALKRSIGMSEKQVFIAWEKEVQSHYHHAYEEHTPLAKTGEVLKTPFQGNYAARWSPDGKNIAIVGIKDYDEGVTDLYLLNTITGKIKKVTGPYVNGFFSWAPHGKSIVYSQKHRVSSGSEINDLFLLNTKSLRIKRLTDHKRASDPHFAPDGKRIVYAVHQGARSNLAVLNIESGEKQIITDFPDWTEVFTPHWSPDGSQIVFSIWDNKGFRDICTIKPDGTEFHRLTQDATDDRYPVWSPDGRQIAFISYRNGIPNLCLMNWADKTIHHVTDSPGGIFNPTWLPDGKRIAVIAFENRDTTEIVILPVEQDSQFVTPLKTNEWLPFHQSRDAELERITKPMPQNEFHHAVKPYHSYANIRSQIVFPYLDKSEQGWQPGLINLSADPLGKHTLLTAVTYRHRPHFFVDYVNQQFSPTIEITANKTTIDHGDFIGVVNQKSGVTKLLPLYENFWSGSVSLYWHINFGRSILSNHLIWLSSTFTYRDIINSDDYERINTDTWVYPLLQGWTNYLTMGYVWQTYRPNVSFDIHPKSGWWFSIYARRSDKWLRSDLNFSQLGLTGGIRHELFFPEHVIAIRASISFRTGKQPVQSRLAIDNTVIRGISYSQEGDQQLYSNIEYRFPLIRDFGLKIWLFYFERFCGALFLDSGKAWGNYLVNLDKLTKQSFDSVSWLQTTGLELRHRLYIFGKIPVVLSGGYAINPSKPDLSNFYLRIGNVF
ncbi:MAG: PD40 domain-containing protein [bacterium]|nr:MAG: PD40 domain-containing protein [bacterium]